jgi:hypothetical protein
MHHLASPGKRMEVPALSVTRVLLIAASILATRKVALGMR